MYLYKIQFRNVRILIIEIIESILAELLTTDFYLVICIMNHDGSITLQGVGGIYPKLFSFNRKEDFYINGPKCLLHISQLLLDVVFSYDKE